MVRDTSCPHHESIGHRIDRLEGRMDRLEVGIFSAIIAILLSIVGLFVQVWDLPSVIRTEIAAQQEKK